MHEASRAVQGDQRPTAPTQLPPSPSTHTTVRLPPAQNIAFIDQRALCIRNFQLRTPTRSFLDGFAVKVLCTRLSSIVTLLRVSRP